MSHTLSIFKHWHKHVSPVIPKEVSLAMKRVLKDHESQDREADNSILEEQMISFGYEVWPFWQAYKDFYKRAEEKLGEDFFLGFLSEDLKAKYFDFKDFEGNMKDLHQGHVVDFFDADEYVEIKHALIEGKQKLKEYVRNEVLGSGKDVFFKKVEKYAEDFMLVQEKLIYLRKLSALVEEYENLAGEIEAKVKGFEYGLCWLGPDLNLEDVDESVYYFDGRRQDLDRKRGIHKTVEINFYS